MDSIKFKNFEFKKNNIYVIFGDNGVGKTTFLTSIFMLSKYFGESIFYDGIASENLKPLQKKSIKNRMIYLKSKGNLQDFLTIRGNLEYLNIDESIISKTKFLDKKPSELSGGEEQIVSLSLLFIKNKDVILLDEVTSFMDQENENIAKEIFNKAKKDKIIILTTHDIRFKMDEAIKVDLTVLNQRVAFSLFPAPRI